MSEELRKLAKAMRDMSDMVGDLHWMAAKAAEGLIRLRGEIAKRDARIAELEGALSWHEEQRNDMAELRAELAAIKEQEPALPKGAIMVGRSELALVRNALALDCEQGRPIRGEMLAELDASIDRLDKLYAAPVSEAKAQGVVMDGSQLAGLLEQVRLNDDEAKPHGSGATYWNNAVIACQVAIRDALNAAPAAPAADDDDIVLNANAQEILSQCIGAHAYVLGVLANGRPDLAFIEAKKWVDAFKKAAAQMEQGHDQ